MGLGRGRGRVVVKRVPLSERSKSTFEVVNNGSRRVGIAAVSADAGTEVDVVVYDRRFCVGCVGEVGFLCG